MTLDLRLLPAALTAWLAAFALTAAGRPAAPVVAACLAAAALAGLPLALRAGRGAPQLALCLAVAACVGVSVTAQLGSRASPLVDRAVADGTALTLVARVTSDPRPLASSWGGPSFRVTLTTRSVATPAVATQTAPEPAALTHEVGIPVVVIGDASWSEVRYGALVETTGRLRAVDDAAAKEQVMVRGPTPPRTLEPAGSLLRAADAAREGMLRVTEHLPAQARGLVPGIAVGDTSRLEPKLDRAMKVTGLTHITAVSGSHFAIIAATVLGLTAMLRLPRAARIVVAAASMAGFVLLVRPEPSVVRAAAMGAFFLAGLALGRPSRAVAALAGCVVVLLLADPWLARSYGFVLSVLATGALVLGVEPLARLLSRLLPSWLAFAVAVPTAAQAACAPVIVLLEPAIATYAVLANLLAAPALVPATIGGVLAALLSPGWHAGAVALATGASWATAWIAWVATTLAGLPGAQLPWPPGARGAGALAYVTVLALLVLLSAPYLRSRVRELGVDGRARATAFVGFLVHGRTHRTHELTRRRIDHLGRGRPRAGRAGPGG